MRPTRRTFLRVLGSALVGAVVAPALPTSLPATDGWLGFNVGGTAYWVPVWTPARETGLVYDVEVAG